MTDSLYQYAVLRYVHDPLTQESLNIGVLLYCAEQKYLQLKVAQQYSRLSTAFHGFDGMAYRDFIRRLENATLAQANRVFANDWTSPPPGEIEQLLPSILVPDDTSFRFGAPGGGLAEDLAAELDALFGRMILEYIETEDDVRRDDNQVWDVFAAHLREQAVMDQLEPITISTNIYEHTFDHAWKNDVWHPLEPLSFDYKTPASIDNKASRWIGHVQRLRRSPDMGKIYFLVGKPMAQDAQIQKAYSNAVISMRTMEHIEVVVEDEASRFATEIAKHIQAHKGT